MTLFSPLSAPMFRNEKLRGRKPGCLGCDAPTNNGIAHEEELNLACGTDEVEADSRISVKALQEVMQGRKPYVLIDTRSEIEFGICSLPEALSMSYFIFALGKTNTVLFTQAFRMQRFCAILQSLHPPYPQIQTRILSVDGAMTRCLMRV